MIWKLAVVQETGEGALRQGWKPEGSRRPVVAKAARHTTARRRSRGAHMKMQTLKSKRKWRLIWTEPPAGVVCTSARPTASSGSGSGLMTHYRAWTSIAQSARLEQSRGLCRL